MGGFNSAIMVLLRSEDGHREAPASLSFMMPQCPGVVVIEKLHISVGIPDGLMKTR
jgi:hypothetical protein